MASQMKITPLGGLGQIGSNAILVEAKSSRVLIDSGILFPYEACFDINYLIPDFYHIEKPEALIITHGHEDHIGAIVHLIKHFPGLPIYAPAFASALMKKKFEYSKMRVPINIYDEGHTLKFDEFSINPIHVNHSIPQTYGLLINSFDDSIFYVSDFKIDKKSPYERPFDFKRLKALTKNANRKILMADSTNITSKNLNTPGEGDLIPHFQDLMNSRSQRVFVTTFSSNIHRIQTIINTAKAAQRKIIAYGRSVNSYSETAEELGLLKNWKTSVGNIEDINLEKERLSVIISGCQGDLRSALRRVATNTDPYFKSGEKDLFIFSSKAIPGNEKAIGFLINELIRSGAEVVTENDRFVHVSGHPGKSDLLELYKVMRPQVLIPIHGEVHFLHKHAHHFLENFPDKEVHILLNHQSLTLNDKIVVNKNEGKPPIPIHGHGIPIEKSKILQRRKMAKTGVIFCSLKGKDLLLTPLGLPEFFIESHIKKAKKLIQEKITNVKKKEQHNLSEIIRIDIRRYCQKHLGYKPVVVVHEMNSDF